MTQFPSRQFWTDPAGITYTRIEDENWVQVNPSQFALMPPNVCFFTVLNPPELT